MKKDLRDLMITPLHGERTTDKGDEYFELMCMVDAINMDKFHVAGRNYEYFLGYMTKGKRQNSQMGDLGQYFTSREIIKYILEKVNPVVDKNGNVPSMGDTFSGSAGFILEYMRYIDKNNNNDWTKQIQNIFGCETDDVICKSARVDIMALTGVCPYSDTKDIQSYNPIKNCNAFRAEYENKKFKYILTNPPYGGDKGKDIKYKTTIENSCKEIIQSCEKRYCEKE